MVVDRSNKLETAPNIRDVENVNEIVYLGCHVNKEGSSSTDMKRRTVLAKIAMTKLTKIWKNHHTTKTTKCKLARTLMFPIVIYEAEA